ncbi:MAG: hypothetical protein PF694_12000 [Bacteroidetes bacterium]|jgi:hypothetical protein|nr:hypothetical protein [Bacteroidota bacterium]
MTQSQKEKSQSSKIVFSAFLQSLSSFMLAYLTIYLFSGIGILYIAYDMDIPASLQLNKITFGIPFDSPLWTKDAIVSVFMAQPVSSFIMGTISILLLLLIKPKQFWLQLFFIWFFLHGFNFTFGVLSEDILLQRGLFRVATVMDIRQVMLILTIGISLFFLIKAGSLAGKLLYSKVFQLYAENRHTRELNFLLVIFLPYLLGSLLILLITLGKNDLKDYLLKIAMFVSLTPIIFAQISNNLIKSDKKKPKLITGIPLFAFSLIAIGFFYSWLRNGFTLG